ncbi:Carbonic anhydrase [Mycena chlorophos]|uniref:Carbonic anhydrase n=1 Tax=Mycena chlorophos TaxID=658473 RepID=A0A8H6VZX7_MYCCL|nr:Carbonic anhydrase [Mycena chlorophos]
MSATQPEHAEFLSQNAQYVASFGDKGALAMPPARKLAIVTCMDARLDPAAHLGLKEGEAHVIRNAGGVAKEALRSLILSQRLLGTREIAVFHHTDCGMLAFTTPYIQDVLKKDAPGDAAFAARVDAIEWMEFNDLEKAVKDDVAYLKSEPLILEETLVTGWVYDVKTGKVAQVV